MKRILILLAALILLVSCSNKIAREDIEASAEEQPEEIIDNDTEGINWSKPIDEIKEDLEIDAIEKNDDTVQTLYLLYVNNLLHDFDEDHEEFTLESGTSFFKLFRTDVATNGLEVAIDNTDNLLSILSPDEQELYGNFLDELIEIEKAFPDLEQFIIDESE